MALVALPLGFPLSQALSVLALTGVDSSVLEVLTQSSDLAFLGVFCPPVVSIEI